jgi:hypothetical protein
LNVFSDIPGESKKILDDFGAIVQRVRPLSSKQQLALSTQIRTLFHFLADERGARRRGYMNDKALLGAYTRSYHWWNLVRLTRLFAGLKDALLPPLTAQGAQAPFVPRTDGAMGEAETVCVDLGAGPLTVATALWLACPELRSRRLLWYCVDSSKNALALGEELFLAVCAVTMARNTAGNESPWRIVRVAGDIGAPIRQRAWLVTAANVLNELADNIRPDTPRGGPKSARLAQGFASTLASYAVPDGLILAVEPGVPQSAALLSEMRDAFALTGRPILAPCTHGGHCPMPGWTGRPRDGERGKWCNFGFSTQDAPKALRKVSKDAGLPKDRAALSFLLAGGASDAGAVKSPVKPQEPQNARLPQKVDVRVISDAMHLPGNRIGCYGCSNLGLILLEMPAASNHPPAPGSLVTVENRPLGIDAKSGATRFAHP